MFVEDCLEHGCEKELSLDELFKVKLIFYDFVPSLNCFKLPLVSTFVETGSLEGKRPPVE